MRLNGQLDTVDEACRIICRHTCQVRSNAKRAFHAAGQRASRPCSICELKRGGLQALAGHYVVTAVEVQHFAGHDRTPGGERGDGIPDLFRRDERAAG